MNKKLILTLATGVACAMTTMADTYDLYVTGATAFRQSIHDSCKGLFDVAPITNATPSLGTLQYGGSASGGNGALNNGNGQWVMRGTVSNSVPALGTNELVIHALFNGSIQGVQTVENKVKLLFLAKDGSVITNTPTIGYTDAASSSTPFDAANTADFAEEKVAVQPFVWIRAVAGSPLMTNINNITYEQAKYLITAGRAKLSAWTYKATDTNLIYKLSRTQDSGTRRVELACNGFGYNQSLTVYNYDQAINSYYLAPNNGSNNATGLTGYGIVGAAGNGGANLTWGPGYVGGGDVRSAVNIANANNVSIGYLSFADAKTAGLSGSNWSAVISFNGMYPTIGTNRSFFKDDKTTPWLWGNTGTNDFSPITSGQYSGYGNETCVYPITDPSALSADQNLTTALLGDATTAGTILGILHKKYAAGVAPVKGSIEYEIEASKPTGATAIRLSDMKTARPAVGGVITP